LGFAGIGVVVGDDFEREKGDGRVRIADCEARIDNMAMKSERRSLRRFGCGCLVWLPL
jgi:hypothetical protein